MLRSRFSWIVLGCLIVAAAFVAGCSMDSGSPMAPAVEDADALFAPDGAADHPQFVRYTQSSAPALAKVLDDDDDESDDESDDDDDEKAAKEAAKAAEKAAKEAEKAAKEAEKAAEKAAKEATKAAEEAAKAAEEAAEEAEKAAEKAAKEAEKAAEKAAKEAEKAAKKDEKKISKLIRKDKGGELEIGDEETIEVELEIEPHSMPYDATIDMQLPEGDILTIGIGGEDGVTFGPHGMTFDPPAKLEIESENLVLPEGDLYLYYWNAELGIWEETGEEVKVKVKNGEIELEVKIHHFSHYAFGVRR